MTRDGASLPRRRLLQLSGGAGALLAAAPRLDAVAQPADVPAALRSLRPMTDGVTPIAVEEHRARLARAQRLLAEASLDAMVVGPGSSLAYFTGVEWSLSERFLGIVLGRSGEPVWIVPSFEKDRALERIRLGKDVRVWAEDESPFGLVAAAIADSGALTGRIGIEQEMPFAFCDGIAQARPAVRLVSATPVTAGCRMMKDAHELALMRRACAITLHAYRSVFASLVEGVTVAQVSGWVTAAHRCLGVRGGALVLFGADAAFPHGTSKPRSLARGDVVLMDGGCRVHGYQSDITRTAVFGGPPTDRQRRIWDLVRRAQAAAFDAARPGVECQAIDEAARRVIEAGGFGSGYSYFTHRLGHGIGLDGHESPYMVRGNRTRLLAGMTFTVEPGIYVPGELGIRHEDTVAVTPDGCENLAAKWSGTPEEPAAV